MTHGQASGGQSFWDHLDELRGVLLRALGVTVVCGVVAFVFKDALFAVVLAPKDAGFVTYRLLGRVAALAGVAGPGDFSVSLINTGLAEQFVIHMKTAMCAGFLCASPYVLYEVFRFVSPALYAHERRYALQAVGWGYVMFLLGVALSYFLVFPFTFRFLGTYQVSGDVANMISLQSYISTLIMLCLTLGLVFEMPLLAWVFARTGLLTAGFMRRYRRHAVVLILVAAAVITPTSDIFTLLLVSLPMWLLYEVSVFVAARCGRGGADDA